MQPDSIGQRGQNGFGFMEQEIQKNIQICSKIGGQRGQNGVRLWNKRYRKGYRYAAR